MGMPTIRWVAAALASLALARRDPAGRHHVQRHPAGQPCQQPGPGRRAVLHVAAVTRLVVTRVVQLPQNHLHFAVPVGTTITDPATARGVAQAICELPAAPHGVMSCPADLGVTYRLSFAARRDVFPVVTVSAGGCGGVSGAGLARRATSATFWTDLARAMGVPHPSSSALEGTS